MIDARVLADSDAMFSHLAAAGFGSLGMWEQLGSAHLELIRRYGAANFKRTVNFEYSQWAVHDVRDPKIAALALRALREPAMLGPLFALRLNEPVATAGVWPIGRRLRPWHLLVHRIYLALLFGLARSADDLGCLQLEEPGVGNPLDMRIGGRRVSQDLCLGSLELNAIARVRPLTTITTAAEIGAGYGRLGWLVQQVAPHVRYDIYDIPPALAIAQNYLEVVLGPARLRRFGSTSASTTGGIRMYTPDELDRARDRTYDLFINVSSFDEMPRPEVERYFELIDRKGRGLVYLKGYRFNRRTGWKVEDYPYRPHWTLRWSRSDPANPRFVEQIFDISKH